jgi:hypothetical protein
LFSNQVTPAIHRLQDALFRFHLTANIQNADQRAKKADDPAW